METKLSLRFWRVALWGTITFLLFSVSFWTCFRVFTSFLVEKRAELAEILPGPFVPGVISGVLALLCVMLALIALRKFQPRREAVRARCRFASHKGNTEMCVQLFGNNGVGNHHVKILLTFHTLNRLMRHLPESGSGLHMHDLFLLAVIAGNSHGNIRPLHLYLGHNRPPTSSCNVRLSASIELPETEKAEEISGFIEGIGSMMD